MHHNLCNWPHTGPFGSKKSIDTKHNLRNVEFTWLRRGLGYDKYTKPIIPVEDDNGYSIFPIRWKDTEFVNDMYNT